MAFQATAQPSTIESSAGVSASGLRVSVLEGLKAAEPVWRELEGRGILTPYQRYDWVHAYCESGFDAPGDIVVLAFADGQRTIALLPLGISRINGVRQARLVGMPISNSDSLIYDPAYGARLTQPVLMGAFKTLSKIGFKVDLVSFHCLVPKWQGHANPLLAFPHAPAPNNLYLGEFSGGDQPYIEQSLPHKRRTNIRRSMRRLSEGHGEITLRVATTPAEVERFHQVFVEQRAKRFRQMGVENVFGEASFQTLFRTLAIQSLGQTDAVFRYHGLFAGEEIIATSLGVTTASHYSQYINSTTDGPASKYSLMGVMLSLLVDELRASGIRSFDMGLGDFDYKTDWTEATTVYDSVIAVSPVGHVAAPVLQAARQVKRSIKQTPAIWNFVRRMLALKAKLRGGA